MTKERYTIEWKTFLDEFKKDIYPIFALYNISFSDAIKIYQDNIIKNGLCEVCDFIQSIELIPDKTEDDIDDWKK